jgi:hypothetical protein
MVRYKYVYVIVYAYGLGDGKSWTVFTKIITADTFGVMADTVAAHYNYGF